MSRPKGSPGSRMLTSRSFTSIHGESFGREGGQRNTGDRDGEPGGGRKEAIPASAFARAVSGGTVDWISGEGSLAAALDSSFFNVNNKVSRSCLLSRSFVIGHGSSDTRRERGYEAFWRRGSPFSPSVPADPRLLACCPPPPATSTSQLLSGAHTLTNCHITLRT